MGEEWKILQEIVLWSHEEDLDKFSHPFHSIDFDMQPKRPEESIKSQFANLRYKLRQIMSK